MAILNGTDSEHEIAVPVGFRYRRAVTPLGGYLPATDRVVEAELELLDRWLRTPAVEPDDPETLGVLLDARLVARQAGPTDIASGGWMKDSLCDLLRDASKRKPGGRTTIGDAVRKLAGMTDLAIELADEIEARSDDLTFNQRVLLAKPGVRDLLLARAVVEHDISTLKSLMNFVLHDPEGVVALIDYVSVSAGREYIHREGLRVANINDPDDEDQDAEDDDSLVKHLKGGRIPFTADSFRATVLDLAETAITSSKYDEVITAAKLDAEIPAGVRPRLIEYIKTSGVVTKANAPFTVPYYLAKASVEAASGSGTPTSSVADPDDPFKVSFFVDDVDALQISTSAVKCASQLYYVMTLGDELGVFDAVRHFTQHYLFRQGFAVEDKVLRRDLENYVFSEQFTGLDTVEGETRLMRCTREAERRAFYRQVFDQGDEAVPGDAPANSDFRRLWKILVLESARYLERVQDSPHPTYVSPQNVMQAVEDLQYNLSTSCVGMATVMTPLMYAELDFVVNRILSHKEVRKHLVPGGGSWWKVIEKLAADRNQRVRASVHYNKARLGYSLIREIAAYTPARFEQEAPFNSFISTMEAFITTQSILQEEAGEDGDERDAGPGSTWSPGAGLPPIPGMPDQIPGMPWGGGGGSPWGGSGYGGSREPGQRVGADAPGSGGHANGSPSGGDEWDF